MEPATMLGLGHGHIRDVTFGLKLGDSPPVCPKVARAEPSSEQGRALIRPEHREWEKQINEFV